MGRVIYIVCHCNSVKRASSVLPSSLQNSGQRWCFCCMCVCSVLPPSSTSSHSVCARTPVSDRLTRAGDPGPNKWYQSRTNAVVGLTVGDDGRFGDGRQHRRCCGCPAMTGGHREHGAGGQQHQLTDADLHQLWRVGGDHEGQAQRPTALECH